MINAQNPNIDILVNLFCCCVYDNNYCLTKTTHFGFKVALISFWKLYPFYIAHFIYLCTSVFLFLALSLDYYVQEILVFDAIE